MVDMVHPVTMKISNPIIIIIACHDCVGLGLCLDSTAEQCCNYYNGDGCVITCPGSLEPNAQFECGELSAWV